MSIKPNTDRTYDLLRSEEQALSAIFNPKTVAVVGATDRPGSVGRTVLWNLIQSPFGGTVLPVNPKRSNVLGIKAYPSIQDIPDPVDLVIIATPAPTVPGLIRDCIQANIPGAIVMSAGFKEAGAAGIALEAEIADALKTSRLRLIGPNCLGVMNPHTGLNATFASAIARPGNVGFISQSGALCTAVLDWSFPENVGFSAFISIGSMLDVDWGDLIYYLGDDPHTQSIVIYMESIGNARSFLSAAREVALTKPIIVLKTGRTDAAAKAAASHTGALAGSDDVLDAAFRRCGVLRVDRISELFDLAEVLAKQKYRPHGPNLTIITNAGGPGVLATDALVRTQGQLAPLAEETLTALNEILPPHWSHGNPIDILGDADPERYAKALDIAIRDPNSDGLLVMLTPQAMTDPTATAEKLQPYVRQSDKPIMASWMGGEEVTAGESLLNQSSVPTYRFPDEAARLFNLTWKYSYNLRGIYETPVLTSDNGTPVNRDRVLEIIEKAYQEGRTLLTEVESKEVLDAYHIPVVPTAIAYSEDEAVKSADSIGYPVVVKLLSTTITHKTDVGGVQLNLRNADSVRWAYRRIQDLICNQHGDGAFLGVTVQPMISLQDSYELIIGSSIDPQFGPIVVFGSGGQLVEIFRDRAIALPPLNTTLARRTMEQTQIYKALKGTRGREPVDLDQLEQLLVAFSQLIVEQPQIREIDINPLLARPRSEKASEQSLVALDARVVLHDPNERTSAPQLAIRPYPIQYAQPWTLRSGDTVMIRPIRPEDEPLIVQFHETLSEQSVYFRYFGALKLSRRIAHERLTRICFIDYDREMALVAEYQNPETGQPQILAAGRLSKQHGVNEAEFSMLVSDPYQKQGLGTELLRRLVQIGRDEKLDRIVAEILAENLPMQRVCEKVGFTLRRAPDIVSAEIRLKD